MTGLGAALLLVGVLIVIHEFGHFAVARLFGVAVPVFSVGFGRRLFGVRWRGTDFRLSLVPFGGYVRMAGADSYALEGDEDAAEASIPRSEMFHQKPVWQRLLIVMAGPVANLILPVVVFSVVAWIGLSRPIMEVGQVEPGSAAAEMGLRPGDTILSLNGTETPHDVAFDRAVAVPAEQTALTVRRGAQTLALDAPLAPTEALLGLRLLRPDAIIGVSDPASPAGQAGLRSGDRLVSIAGAPVDDWVDIAAALEVASGPVPVEVARADGAASLTLRPVAGAPAPRSAADWGVFSGLVFVGEVSDTVGDRGGVLDGCRPASVEPPAPAKAAGMQTGDHLLAVDGVPLHRWSDLTTGVSAAMDSAARTVRPVRIDILRAGERKTLELIPQIVEDTDASGSFLVRPIIGVRPLGRYAEPASVRVSVSPVEAIGFGFRGTWNAARAILNALGGMLIGEKSIREGVGGPLTIATVGAEAAEQGWDVYLQTMAAISVSLAIVNFLPVPVLDGGQMLFFLMEMVRGRPVSPVVRERAQQIGVLVMMVVMLSVLVFDIQRFLER